MDLGLIYQRSLQKLQIKRALLKMQLTQLTNAIQHFQEFLASAIISSEAVDTQIQSRLSWYGLTFSLNLKCAKQYHQSSFGDIPKLSDIVHSSTIIKLACRHAAADFLIVVDSGAERRRRLYFVQEDLLAT